MNLFPFYSQSFDFKIHFQADYIQTRILLNYRNQGAAVSKDKNNPKTHVFVTEILRFVRKLQLIKNSKQL